jgi:hypothetical protein
MSTLRPLCQIISVVLYNLAMLVKIAAETSLNASCILETTNSLHSISLWLNSSFSCSYFCELEWTISFESRGRGSMKRFKRLVDLKVELILHFFC